MYYTETSRHLKSNFFRINENRKDDITGVGCRWERFHSSYRNKIRDERRCLNKPNLLVDDDASENQSFDYPVFLPENYTSSDKAIILLHGLNERNWNKYLTWATTLSVNLNRPVILFPFAYHINRSPSGWVNLKALSKYLDARKGRFSNNSMATLANVALSERLSDDPLRFYTSGLQSALDLIQLMNKLQSAEVSAIGKVTQVDFFAYSIGVFLAQVLFLGNPQAKFSASRFFLFCGGALFDQMNGTSRLIMDDEAFHQLRRYYIKDLYPEAEKNVKLLSSLRNTELGQAFLAMLTSSNHETFRNEAFQKRKSQIRAIVLKQDRVIPSVNSMEVLGAGQNIVNMDFPYPYIHENPFPVFENASDAAEVDSAFSQVFSKALDFLR